MARILVDMNLSTEWIPLQTAAGHEGVHWHWSGVGDPREPDQALMAWSVRCRYAVIANDLDFDAKLIKRVAGPL